MTSQPDASEPPVFLVVGRTRIGKGKFISTAHSILHGSEIPDIVSRRRVSHTSMTQGYPMRLGDCDIRMVDTVGFDDSSGTNIPEDTLLRFLQDTGKADFYPPLVILQTLSALEKDLLMKMAAVFSKIVVAFRLEDESELDAAQEDVLDKCAVEPVKIFSLQTFVSETLDSGNSRQLYDNGVSAILDFYKTLTPSREKLDFGSPMFAGVYKRRPCPPETKSELVTEESQKTRRETRPKEVPAKKALDNLKRCEDSITETIRSGLRIGICNAAGSCLCSVAAPELALFLAVAAVPFLGGTSVLWILKEVVLSDSPLRKKVENSWDKNTKQEIQVNVRYKITRMIRRTFEREVHTVWKILAGEITIFKGYHYGPWKAIGDELLYRSESELPPDPPKEKVPLNVPEGKLPADPTKEKLPPDLTIGKCVFLDSESAFSVGIDSISREWIKEMC